MAGFTRRQAAAAAVAVFSAAAGVILATAFFCATSGLPYGFAAGLLLEELLAMLAASVRIVRCGGAGGDEPLLFWPLSWTRQAAWMLFVFAGLWIVSRCCSVWFEALFPSTDEMVCAAALSVPLGAAFAGAAAWVAEAAAVAAASVCGNAGKGNLG